MLHTEFPKFRADLIDNLMKTQDALIELEQKGETNRQVYLDTSKYAHHFLNYKMIESNDIFGKSLNNLKNEISIFEKDIEEYRNKINFDLSHKTEIHNNTSEYYLTASYYEVYKGELIEYTIKRVIKEIINEKIKSRASELGILTNTHYYGNLDCKMLELFINGSIDFDTLTKITYTSNRC